MFILYILLDLTPPQGVPPLVRLMGPTVDIGKLREVYWSYTDDGGGEGCNTIFSADYSLRDNLVSFFSSPLPLPDTSEQGCVYCGA